MIIWTKGNYDGPGSGRTGDDEHKNCLKKGKSGETGNCFWDTFKKELINVFYDFQIY